MPETKDDPEPLTEKQRQLVAAHLVHAAKLANMHSKTRPWLADEFHSSAYFAVCEAARTFDRSRGVSFVTHACNRVQGACLDVARGGFLRGYGRQSRLNGEAPPAVSSLEPEVLSIASPSAPVGRDLEALDLIECLSVGLPERSKQVMKLRYLDGLEMKEIGERVGLCFRTVQHYHEIAIKRLRQSTRLKELVA